MPEVEKAGIRRRWRRVVRWRSIRPWWRRFRANGYRLDRCDHCGHRFRWMRDSRFGQQGSNKHWHGPCQAYLAWRRRADERLAVVGVMAELSGLTASDLRETMSLRDSTGQPGSGSEGWNAAWRVFYDLERSNPPGRWRGGEDR